MTINWKHLESLFKRAGEEADLEAWEEILQRGRVALFGAWAKTYGDLQRIVYLSPLLYHALGKHLPQLEGVQLGAIVVDDADEARRLATEGEIGVIVYDSPHTAVVLIHNRLLCETDASWGKIAQEYLSPDWGFPHWEHTRFRGGAYEGLGGVPEGAEETYPYRHQLSFDKNAQEIYEDLGTFLLMLEEEEEPLLLDVHIDLRLGDAEAGLLRYTGTNRRVALDMVNIAFKWVRSDNPFEAKWAEACITRDGGVEYRLPISFRTPNEVILIDLLYRP